MFARVVGGICFVATTIVSGDSLACSCAPVRSAEHLMANSTAIFTGVAETARTPGPGRTVTTFRVVESFKGVAAGARVAVSHRSGPPASCGVTFPIGGTSTLTAYLDGSSGMLSASSCSTWMFHPNVSSRERLIGELRALKSQK